MLLQDVLINVCVQILVHFSASVNCKILKPLALPSLNKIGRYKKQWTTIDDIWKHYCYHIT